MFDLTDKRALVTGATGGIGGAVAKALHAQGASVAISGTRREKLEGLAEELKDPRFTSRHVICRTLMLLMLCLGKHPTQWAVSISSCPTLASPGTH